MKLRRATVAITLIAPAMSPIVVSAAELPVPCIAGVCGATASQFITSGQAVASAVGNTLQVQQSSDRAILNWASFNISADGRVNFQQPGANAVALNRIFQASPSQIFGALEANGQIFLINQNGFVFGAGSRVKTAGLLASTLDMTDSTFQNGLLAPNLLQAGEPPLKSDGRVGVLDADRNPVLGPDGKPLRVQIVVEQGAEITTAGSGQRVMLAGQNVDNAGRISAPDGQVLLAAGEEVFLEASTDPALRGLLVEVNRGGEAWNRLTGEITAARGNVSIAGLAVNQHGRISATTSVAANGSIRLLARDTVEQRESHYVTTRAGEVELGAQSVTSVLPELQDTATAVDDQPQLKSRVDIMGREVMLRGGSSIVAPSGEVRITAVRNPADAGAGIHDPESRIRMETGARIDVAGSTATLPITRNLVTAELRANEFRDSPLQRNGALRGQPIVVDARVGTPFGDVSGALATIPRDIAERTSVGGNAIFNSEGDVVVNAGAHIDVSGGRINYEGGAIQTTQLVAADGSIVDIGLADPNKVYVAAINPTFTRRYDRWGVVETVLGPGIGRFEPGYVEGRSAGTLQFAAPAMVLDGSFSGSAISGPFQRDPARTPAGGRFIVGLPNGVNSALRDNYWAPSVSLGSPSPPIAIGDGGTLPPTLMLHLPVDFMRSGGFTRSEIYSNGVIELAQDVPLELAAGSSLRLQGNSVNLNSDITTAGGSIELRSVFTTGVPGDLPTSPGVRIGEGVTLNVSGTWTNDVADTHPTLPPLTNVVYRNAGSIVLNANAVATEAQPEAAELVLGNGSQFLANGGAWLTASGELNAGRGGLISFGAPADGGALEIGDAVQLQAYGVRGASGGTFELAAGRLAIEDGATWASAQRFEPIAESQTPTPGEEPAPAPGEPPVLVESLPLTFGDALFSDHGFSTFRLTATGPTASEEARDVLHVREGSVIDTRAASLELLGSLQDRSTGSDVLDFARAALAPEFQRRGSTLTLSVAPTHDDGPAFVGRLNVDAGTTIFGDARSVFNFSGSGGVSLNGAIDAASGTVRVDLPNPVAEVLDPGYDPQLQIEIGSSASIDVSGTALLRPNDTGLNAGDVLSGGTIRLLADRGSVNVRSGSVLDVSGASTPLDVPDNSGQGAFRRQTVASAGGAIELRAPESIVLLGDISARAGQGDTGAVAAGSLSIQLSREAGFRAPQDPTLAATFPTTPRVVRVISHQVAGEPGALNGFSYLNLDRLNASGIDSLALRGGDAVEFDSGIDLSLDRSLTIDSPIVAVNGAGTVNLEAPYVAFGFNSPQDRGAQNLPGAAQLNVRGDLIELLGATDLAGIDHATFASTGDIRLRSVHSTTDFGGALRIAGDLTLSAARIYPGTLTRFTLGASGGERDLIRIEQTGVSPGVPLSVGGSLQVNAKEIIHDGTLLVPFGSITLNASESLSLLDGSVASVSAGSTRLPFGRVQLGSEWVYELAGVNVPQNSLPVRRVELSAPNISTAAGSTVDISGGGDLYAYEWVPGTGGSADALHPSESPGLYAILPSMRGQFAPHDPQEFAGSDLMPGDSVYLSGMPGLEEGIYPLLPARYALLPGALLVSAVSGTTDMRPADMTTQPNGATVIAGRRTFASTGLGDARLSGFAVQPGSYGRQLAAYEDSLASTFYPARAARLELDHAAIPADAGTFALSPMVSLDAQGRVLTAAAAGGRGAAIDVTAQNLQIVGGSASSSEGAIQLSSSVLASWNASRLLLGGRRSSSDGSVEVLADSVSIIDGASVTADEVIAVARNEVAVSANASVTSRTAPQTTELEALSLSLIGDGAADSAVLALSNLSRLSIERPSGAADAPARINLQEGSQLTTRGALLIDAPGGATLAGGIDGRDATIDLASRRIVFGDQPIADGITVTRSLAERLEEASRVRVSSSGAIEFHAATMLGVDPLSSQPLIDELSLSAAVIRAVNPDVAVTLGANELLLEGVATADESTLTAGSSTLSLSAGTIGIGAGHLAIDGFGSTAIAATGELIGEGDGTLRVAGPLGLTAARITTSQGADTRIEATGAINIARSSATAVDRALQLGGSLTISGRSIDHAGTIALPSGLVTLRADEQISFGAGAVIDVGGMPVMAAGREVSSWGGTIDIEAGGDISAAATSSFLLAGAGDADAGRLLVRSAGAVDLASQFDARASDAAHGGTFVLDAGSLVDFGGLNARLETAGFNEVRDIRIAAGDLALANGQSITASSVRLATDNGTVRVAGAINARSDNERSSIGLFGTNGVVLENGASLRAEGSGEESRGGLVTLGTSAGAISLLEGSRISTGGGIEDGRVLVRAPAIGNDVAVSDWSAAFSDVGSVTIEPVLAFDAVPATLTAVEFETYRAAAAAYASTAIPTIESRLTVPTGTALFVQPGVELRRDGDLTLAALSLNDWRFDGRAGALSVRATGSISVNGTISDGFIQFGSGVNARTDLLTERSTTIRMAAGSVLASADVTAVNRSIESDLTIGAGAVVRTGTGDLALSAARDLVFAGAGSAAYTAGVAGAPSTAPQRGASASFATQGGQLSLIAGRDIVGTSVVQSPSQWQPRQGRGGASPLPTFWGAELRQFGWNAGTLGGGDIALRAGRDVRNISAAAADSAIEQAPDVLTQFVGGVLSIDAGRDVSSALLHATHGDNRVRTDGAMNAARTDSIGTPVGSVLSIQDASVDITARSGVTIESAFNSTLLEQPGVLAAARSTFSTHTERSALSASTASGDLELAPDLDGIRSVLGNGVVAGANNERVAILPSSAELHSLSGDVALSGRTVLMSPSDRGQLDIFAAQDLRNQTSVQMSDSAGLPTPLNPSDGGDLFLALTLGSSGRHAGDTQPVLITAGHNIEGGVLGLPKATRMIAGNDILDVSFVGQNLDSRDVTLISAGRDLRNGAEANSQVQIQLGGPGRLDVIAGRDVDLGFSKGISTVGRLVNPNLTSEQGADLNVLAGFARDPDVAAFVDDVIAGNDEHQAALIEYVARETSQTPASFEEAAQTFESLDAQSQRPFVMDTFFHELVASGREANSDPELGFTRGFSAIDALFPGSRPQDPDAAPNPYDGDLRLAFSRIYTVAGGTISLLAPGGLVNVGLANPPASVNDRPASELGIVAQRAGDVRSFSDGDVLVNQSRVFTLGGGDIAIWSTTGDIDAGRGSKTAISAPPPAVLVDSSGQVTLDFAGAVAGSGIRTILTGSVTEPGDVDLIAPAGIVNAGDAGIGSAGNLNVAAQTVVGLDNIQVGGTSTGVPAETSNLGASLSGVSATASSAANTSAAVVAQTEGSDSAQQSLADSALSWLEVFVVGLGEEQCKPTDLECLKRQATQ